MTVTGSYSPLEPVTAGYATIERHPPMLALPDTAPALVDALPTELPDLATRKAKPPAKPAPPTKLLIGTEGSIVYAGFDEDLACWQYSCIGPNGITATYGSAQAAKTAYRTLPQKHGA